MLSTTNLWFFYFLTELEKLALGTFWIKAGFLGGRAGAKLKRTADLVGSLLFSLFLGLISEILSMS
jgi:hypothetical protein